MAKQQSFADKAAKAAAQPEKNVLAAEQSNSRFCSSVPNRQKKEASGSVTTVCRSASVTKKRFTHNDTD